MAFKLMLDEDVHLALAAALRQRGHDVVHVRELSRRGLSDEDQLEHAVAEGRCLFTFNVGHFVELHNSWVEEQREHFGILVSKQRPLGGCLRRLLPLLQTARREGIYNQLSFLQ